MPKEPYYERKINKVIKGWGTHLKRLAKKGVIGKGDVAVIHKIFTEEAAKRDDKIRHLWEVERPHDVWYKSGITISSTTSNPYKRGVYDRLRSETDLDPQIMDRLTDKWEKDYRKTLVPEHFTPGVILDIRYYEPKRHLRKSLWKL